jgi:nicotinate-nucleotide adenylyltransferase
MVKKIGIFGGTFDPIHMGHLRAAEEFGQAMGLDKVLMILSARPPHRNEPSVPAHDRLEMLRAAVSGNPMLEASDLEITREGPSYTIDTVRRVSEMAGGSRPWLALGSDAWREIASWRQPGDVLAETNMVVLARPGVEPDLLGPIPGQYSGEYTGKADGYTHSSGATLISLKVTALDISSTRLRRMAAEGQSLRYLVPQAVFEYIHRNGLYRD